MAAIKKPAKGLPASAKPKAGKKPAASLPEKKAASKTAKPAEKKTAAAKPAAAKTPAPKPAAQAAPRKPLPGPAAPIPGTVSDVPAQIITFLEKFDALKPGKTWAAKAAALVAKIPPALFGDFEDALDLGAALSTGRIPLHAIDPKTAKPAAAKPAKGGSLQIRPSQKTFETAVFGNKIGREELEELIERLRCCLCCCHCWPCRPWPFCRFCRRCSVWVSTPTVGGLASHLHFTDAAVSIASRKADITCGGGGGPWAPEDHDHDGDYAPIGHDHDADYATDDHDHDAVYAPKKAGSPAVLIKYAEIDTPVGQTVKLRDKATPSSDVTVSLSGHNHDAAYAPKTAGSPAVPIKYVELRSVDAAAKTATLRDVVTSPTPSDVVVSQSGHNHDGVYALSGHNHDTAYAAASHGNTNHSKKYFSRTNLIMKVNPDTTLEASHYWVKVQLNLPVGFAPGTSDWTECISGVCMDPTMAAAPLDLKAMTPTVVTEMEGGTNVPKLKFRLTDSGGTDYRKNNGIWAGKLVVVTVAAPVAD